jgi:hypothetical protein
VRKTPVFLTGGAVILLAAAAVLRLVVVPEVRQVPGDLDTTLRYAGSGDMLDLAALQSGDLSRVLRAGVPFTAEQRVRVVSTHDDTAVVSDGTTINADGAKLSATAHTWAVDRVTLDAAPAPSGTTVQPHEGLVFGFPLSPKPHDYPFWDTATQSRATAAYQRTERHAGRETYVYAVRANGPLKATDLVPGLPAALPKATLTALASLLPAATQQGLAASAAQLPDPLPLAYTATAEAMYWVDTATGYVVDVEQKQVVDAAVAMGGTTIPIMSAFSASLRFTPDTVSSIADDAAAAQRGLTVVGTVVPIVLVVLAVLLVLIAVLLARRGRGDPPTARRSTGPTGARPSTVGASDEG